jgi:hypothetical protein
MCRIRHRRWPRIGRAAIAGLLLIQNPVFAQDVTEPALKAAFIYNFAKFTEWPAAPAQEPFVLCVVGDAAVGDALVQAVKARVLAGQNLSVSFITPGGASPKCRLIYVSGVTAGQAEQLLAGLRDVPVLTISDLDGFTELGGTARFFFESGQLRFSVNRASAERAHLRISSKLLSLAIRK